MSKETKKVRTTQRIVNPSHDPRKGSSEAVFAAGVEISVPSSLAETWIANGQAEAVAEAKAEDTKSDKKK